MPEPPGHRVISAQTAAQLRQMLEGVLAPGGTASEVSVPGYTLAGKTGTAQVAVNGGYSDTRFVASFVGFAPAQDPQLLVAVVVDEPQGELLRRHGRRARVRRDRQVRAALPRDPAGPARSAAVHQRRRPRIAAMELRELLAGAEVAEIAGDGEVEIAGLAYDSRSVEPGTLFFCVPGQRSDGHEFGRRAVEARRRRARRRAAPGPAGDPGSGRRCPRGDGPGGGSLLGRPDGASCASRASPAPTGRRRPPS